MSGPLPRGAARLVARSLAAGRMSRPGLAHPFAELARIGAVAAPALAGLATTAGLVLAALAHALLDLVLGALIALVARHDISSRDPGVSPLYASTRTSPVSFNVSRDVLDCEYGRPELSHQDGSGHDPARPKEAPLSTP